MKGTIDSEHRITIMIENGGGEREQIAKKKETISESIRRSIPKYQNEIDKL